MFQILWNYIFDAFCVTIVEIVSCFRLFWIYWYIFVVRFVTIVMICSCFRLFLIYFFMCVFLVSIVKIVSWFRLCWIYCVFCFRVFESTFWCVSSHNCQDCLVSQICLNLHTNVFCVTIVEIVSFFRFFESTFLVCFSSPLLRLCRVSDCLESTFLMCVSSQLLWLARVSDCFKSTFLMCVCF